MNPARFEVPPSTLTWVPNFDRTRYFLVLSLAAAPSNELNRLLHATNRAAVAFKQPVLYASQTSYLQAADSSLQSRRSHSSYLNSTGDDEIPDMTSSFHVSIAWSLSRPEIALEEFFDLTHGNFSRPSHNMSELHGIKKPQAPMTLDAASELADPPFSTPTVLGPTDNREELGRLRRLWIPVGSVKAKIGNAVRTFALAASG